MKLPIDVNYIIETLNNSGHEAYIVGGCVRDYLLGFEPHDWDITTSALPMQTKELFTHTFDTGIKHGTVTVVLNHKNYEVTTYRIEGDYVDFRHPGKVKFTEHIDEDLSRRDFTMNAIAYHEKNGFVDPYGGRDDIKAKIIKGVGNPDMRFKEDALRMMRAVRFSAQLNFEIENNTLNAIIENSALIKNISIERIREEFTKLICSKHVDRLILLRQSGLLGCFFPELCQIIDDKKDSLIKGLSLLDECHVLRYSFLLNTFTPEETTLILKKLKFDTNTIREVSLLVKWQNKEILPEYYSIRKAMSIIGAEEFAKLMQLKKSLLKAENKSIYTILKIEEMYKTIISDNDCVSIKSLAVNGNDIKALGIKDGLKIGEILKTILDEILHFPNKNNKAEILKIVREMNK